MRNLVKSPRHKITQEAQNIYLCRSCALNRFHGNVCACILSALMHLFCEDKTHYIALLLVQLCFYLCKQAKSSESVIPCSLHPMKSSCSRYRVNYKWGDTDFSSFFLGEILVWQSCKADLNVYHGGHKQNPSAELSWWRDVCMWENERNKKKDMSWQKSMTNKKKIRKDKNVAKFTKRFHNKLNRKSKESCSY